MNRMTPGALSNFFKRAETKVATKLALESGLTQKINAFRLASDASHGSHQFYHYR